MSLPSVTLFSIHKPKSSNNHTSGLNVFYFIQAIDVFTSSDPIMRLSHNRALRLARGYADRTLDDRSNGYNVCAQRTTAIHFQQSNSVHDIPYA